MSVRFLASLIPFGLVASCASLPDAAQSTGAVAQAFNCATETSLSFGAGLLQQLASVRAIEPSADGATDHALATDADHAMAAYTLYNAFEAGEPPADAFDVPGYGLIGLIYGSPGRDTERRRVANRTQTLYGYVAQDFETGRMLIAFRGTMQPAEWVRNVQVRQDPLSFGGEAAAAASVHRGFQEIYTSLEFEDASGGTPFSEMFTSGILNSGEVTFVGHSLGGALATLASTEASLRYPSNAHRIEVTTLASPRVGNQAFADLASAVGRHTRVCNVVDPVPAAPISTQNIEYVHAGEVRRYSSFDYAELLNDLGGSGDQVLCWHAASSYRLMLEPDTFAAESAECVMTDGS